jgi:ribonuclease D
MSSPIIATPDALLELAERLHGSGAIALDTEFMRERTYRAELCLLQFAVPERAGCVDPLALPDLTPLRAALSARSTVKVIHAARQDLEVLHPALGTLGPVFDTQVAAALAGFAAQVGYGELVRVLLGRELLKAHTRADWSRRPLPAEQLEYALDDVRYLLPLREELIGRLERLGRLDWLREDLEELADPTGLEVDPERAWLRVRGLGGLDPERETLARALAAWRERRAIARNRPRGWILDDAVLREIVLRVPRTRPTLAGIEGMPEGVVRHSGEELLALIASSGLADPPPPLPRRERPDPALVAALKRLSERTQQVAAELQLAPEILATRRELERIAKGDAEAAPLNGWRRAVIGDALRAAL